MQFVTRKPGKANVPVQRLPGNAKVLPVAQIFEGREVARAGLGSRHCALFDPSPEPNPPMGGRAKEKVLLGAQQRTPQPQPPDGGKGLLCCLTLLR